MPPSKPALVFATASCSAVSADGMPVQLTIGDVWDGNDPFVKANRSLFSATPPMVRRTTAERVIEQATAAPGEKRTTNRG